MDSCPVWKFLTGKGKFYSYWAAFLELQNILEKDILWAHCISSNPFDLLPFSQWKPKQTNKQKESQKEWEKVAMNLPVDNFETGWFIRLFPQEKYLCCIRVQSEFSSSHQSITRSWIFDNEKCMDSFPGLLLVISLIFCLKKLWEEMANYLSWHLLIFLSMLSF